jgi:hypothetical protein
MNRYFFDVACRMRVHYDYQGRDLERPDQARDIAELIAIDIECTDNSGAAGMEVQVRNAVGQKLFVIPVTESALQAA